MSVTSVTGLGTWLEIAQVIAAMRELHHPVAGNINMFTYLHYVNIT